MPNIKSAKKRVRVICTKTQRNKAYKSALRTAIKIALEEKTDELARAALKKLDQAVSKGIMHRNTAARKKAAVVRVCKAR